MSRLLGAIGLVILIAFVVSAVVVVGWVIFLVCAVLWLVLLLLAPIERGYARLRRRWRKPRIRHPPSTM